jgi:hypothetical protein
MVITFQAMARNRRPGGAPAFGVSVLISTSFSGGGFFADFFAGLAFDDDSGSLGSLGAFGALGSLSFLGEVPFCSDASSVAFQWPVKIEIRAVIQKQNQRRVNGALLCGRCNPFDVNIYKSYLHKPLEAQK